MSRAAWLFASVAALGPAEDPVARGQPRHPTRLELGVAAGDYVFTVGSATQLRYAPTFDLSLVYGLPRVSAVGLLRLAAPIELPGTIAAERRQFATAGGFGVRSLFVERQRVRFGMSLLASFERLDSVVLLGPLPGLDEPGHLQRRVTHHAGLGLANELGVVLPTTRGPTTVLTFGSSLTFVFPLAASRSGSDVATTRYGADELGVVAGLGGATVLVQLGVMFGWELSGRSAQGGVRAGAG